MLEIAAEDGGSAIGGWILLAVLFGLGGWGALRDSKKDDEKRKADEELGIFRYTGQISARSDFVHPHSGEGTVTVDNLKIRWETARQTDKAYWSQLTTFAQRGGLVHVEWVDHSQEMPDRRAGFQFRGIPAWGQQIKDHARKHLTRGTWQENVDFGPEGQWDSYWSSTS